MNGLQDFVPGSYPLPWNVITMSGLQDFVPAGFPLPWNPVFYPSSGGSLPKAPPLPMALIGAKNGKAAMAAGDGCGTGCGCGGSCGGCGMGSLSSDTIIPQASLPTFLQGDAYITGFPTVYLAGAVVLGLVLFMGGKRGRR